MAEIALGGDPTRTNGQLPEEGEQLKNYSFVNNNMKEVSLSDFEGKKVVLNIFPSIDTGVCATSVRKFNEEASKIENGVVLCVSRDLPFAHKRFCMDEGINHVHTLSNFRNEDFARDLGVTIETGAFEGLNARAIVVLDEDRKVIYTQLVKEIGEEPDYDKVLALL